MDAGIHTVTAETYHSDPSEEPSLSASIIHLLTSTSPRHAWTNHPKLNPDFVRDHDEKFDVGTVAHALLLQGADIVELVDAPDWRTQAAKDARDEARRNGRIPLLAKQLEQVTRMLDATRPQLDAIATTPPLFTDGKPEQTLVWEDKGVVCRARADWLRDDHQTIDDFKTTSRTANPEQWSRSLYGMGCDIQAAFYLRGLRKLTGADAEFRFVVQETYPPYALSVVALKPHALNLADTKIEYALSTWRRCLDTDTWPAYPQAVCYADLPSYLEAAWLEKEEREAA